MEIKNYSKIKETENSTRRELIEHYDNFINESNLDKDQIYSWPYFNQFKIVLEKYSDKKSTRILKFCKVHGWCAHYKSSGKCNRCQSDKYGLGNKEIHEKTIKSQLERGTFNMLDPEVQKHKTSNSNLNDKIIDKFCDICQKETKHHLWPSGKISCMKCNSKNNGPKIKICPIHGETLHNGIFCIKCNPESLSMPPKQEMKYCKIHKKNTLHLGKYCLICNPESAGGNKTTFIAEKLQPCGHMSKSVLIDNNYQCWQCYKEDYLKEIQKSEIQDFVKIPKDKESIISEMNLGNIFLLLDNEEKPSTLSHNYKENSLLYQGNLSIQEISKKLNISYGTKTTFMPEKLQSCGHMSKSVLIDNSYQCWQCYKEKYFKNLNSDFSKGLILPTFLSQNSTNSIPGNKFEELLIEQNVTYFVYIKFHENGKPLVVGESASKLINNSGSDLSFDKDINGGPARQLLIETNTNWDRTSVSIIKTNNKEESILLEYFLSSKYSLLMS